jgi:hypothetical protein
MYLGFDIRISYRKIGRCHHLGQDGFHKFGVKGAAMHVHLGAFEIKGLEEGKAHEMIPMSMGEKKMNRIALFFGDVVPESSNTGAGINNNHIIAVGSDFQAGRIAAVF